ncbi:EAL domain-containing protein [Marinicella sp. S1101]|uniref:EAL domain-containing protein n=1 Tax=Marinicella marina TaxID=2996016 RepID=UPI0022608A30|nr:EAL domain-containing protein [Marinicella marina]MCX7554081.1 EAL domain-containing protein [Marinicella marina]MDJ1141226.1 EAL domain-containing protein [Marinicella marina]
MKLLIYISVSLAVLLQSNFVSAQDNQSERQTYKIGYFDSAPLSFRNNDLQQADGFAIELMNQIADLNDFSIEWYYDEFPNLLNLIKSKRIDGIVSVGYSSERAQFMSYSSNSFANVWGQVFLPANSSIENLFDLDGKTIALMATGVNGINFINQCEIFEVNCNYVYENSYPEVFKKLNQGLVDAAVSNNMVGLSFQDQFSIFPSSIVFDPFKVFIAVPKNTNKQLLSSYNQTMADWKKNPDSFYYQTRYKWTTNIKEDIIPNWIWYWIFGLVTFGLMTGLAAFLFKRQVNSRVKELSDREHQLDQIINIVPHMIFANSEDGRLILANDTARDLFGIKQNSDEHLNVFDTLKAHEGFQDLVTYTQLTNPFDTEIEIKDHAGHEKTLMMTKVPYSASNKTKAAVVTVGVDISQLKAYENEIMYLAKYDALTGLPNRDLLKDRLKSSLTRAIQYNHVGGILHIDLDNFKNINDSKGHKVGDILIKKVALRIKSCANPGDTIARLGGDEFIIELPELKNDAKIAETQAIEMAQSILEKIKQPIEINNQHYHITASMGLVIYPRDGESHATLLQRADTAMFEAKFKGRNRIQVFNKDIETKVMKNHLLENDLRLALQNKEINIVYQPIVNASNGQMAGSEILLRWLHHSEGEIMPGDFIPIAERAQLILEIGYWTIEEACKQIVSWRNLTKNPFFLAVNLSVIQIRDKTFLQRVTDLIETYQIPHNHLEFEMTESILLTESKRSLEMIKQLKLLGIKLSIDDFGTGYSSFDYIRKLPLDKIKIDKSFIKDIPDDNSSTTIVKTILAMAEEMQLEVVAEGVETAEQVEFLKKHHCQYFQGYYFSRPKPIKQLNQTVNF